MVQENLRRNRREEIPKLRDAYKPKESDIKKQIRKFLRACGIWHYNHWQGQFSEPGISDLGGIFRGKPLYIEVKVPNFNRSTKTFKQQEAFLQQAKNEGAICIIATSVDDVIDSLGMRDSRLPLGFIPP